jgi:hypothetical protein
MSIIDLPDWLNPQTLSPPRLLRSTATSVGRYSSASDVADMMSGDTWAMSIGLAPTRLADSGRVEALVNQLAGGVNLLRCHHLGRPVPRGNLRGNLVLSATTVAGAKVLSVSGGVVPPNLMAYSGFELDSNADGLADGWSRYIFGSVSGVSFSAGGMVGTTGSRSQRVSFTGLGTAAGDRVGVYRDDTQAADVQAGPVAVSVYGLVNAGCKLTLFCDFYDASDTIIVGASASASVVGTGSVQRLVATSSPTAWRRVRMYLYGTGVGSAFSGSIWWDCAQVQLGSAATDHSGSPSLFAGDILGLTGSLLLQCANDVALFDGAGDVALANAVRAVVVSGAGITWNRPAALWRLVGQPSMLMQPGMANGVQLDLLEKAF